ncbi:MAG: DUF3048 domain-containing protein [Ruminococcaceae bacterium]|nr:DUF3048 domain-containing protein [Oscillospiraceae bacterium]
MKKTRIALLISFLLAALLITGACKGKDKEADTTAKDKDSEKIEDTTAKDKETDADTTAKEDEPFVIPEFVNPLTGLGTEKDLSKKRPVSIMVNNIGVSLPQEGISQADILYECLAEGGITRLMMITTDYDDLTKVGSVRSARDYYIDYADGYDCIFVHAGGSTYAYNTFNARGTNRIDGVNGPAALYYTYATFERDPERLKQFATEHTLVVKNGEGLKKAIEYYGYRTEKNAGYEKPMNFVDFEKTATLANKATHAKVVMSNYQTVDFVYSEDTGLYSRYQYNGQKHIDNSTGEQLAFKNVLVLFTYTAAIPGDDKARIDIGTTGSGSGWYLTEGTYQKITWKKESSGAVLKYYFEDGTEVQFNRGKTMINVVPTYNESAVKFDNEWKDK